jgi:two-component system cell cycle sensor histidine kinase/response regulator CckA
MPVARIMVVEDESIVAMDIKMRLEGLGYGVTGTASSGEEAVALALRTRPDLVLMDIMLKGSIDGIEAAKRIKATLEVPVVYLTAYADEDTLQRAKVAEPFGYILKPFEERELRTAVETALYKHRVEARLRENERWLSTILTSIGDAVIATDAGGRVMFMNPVAEALTGWRQPDALGKEVAEMFQLADQETQQRVEGHIERALKEGVVVSLPDYTLLLRKGGAPIPISESVSPIKDDKGNVAGAVLIFQDASERRRLRQQMLRAEKLAALGQLTAGLAHELNNPLTPILLYTRMLLGQPALDAESRERLEVVSREVERVRRIVQDLHSFARQYQATKADVNVNDLLSHAAERATEELNSHRIQVRCELEDNVHIAADAYLLQQVFLNIIRNAGQAIESADRGGTIIVKSERRGEPGSAGVRVSISDDGPGIADEILDKVFDPFFTTKPVGMGAGLGLSISYGVVKEHGGTISVENTPAGGATFIIELPA